MRNVKFGAWSKQPKVSSLFLLAWLQTVPHWRCPSTVATTTPMRELRRSAPPSTTAATAASKQTSQKMKKMKKELTKKLMWQSLLSSSLELTIVKNVTLNGCDSSVILDRLLSLWQSKNYRSNLGFTRRHTHIHIKEWAFPVHTFTTKRLADFQAFEATLAKLALPKFYCYWVTDARCPHGRLSLVGNVAKCII